jgi:hypothetical protein
VRISACLVLAAAIFLWHPAWGRLAVALAIVGAIGLWIDGRGGLRGKL